jgi:hypothetical protein
MEPKSYTEWLQLEGKQYNSPSMAAQATSAYNAYVQKVKSQGQASGKVQAPKPGLKPVTSSPGINRQTPYTGMSFDQARGMNRALTTSDYIKRGGSQQDPGYLKAMADPNDAKKAAEQQRQIDQQMEAQNNSSMGISTGMSEQFNRINKAMEAGNKYGLLTGAGQAGKSVEQQQKDMDQLEEARQAGIASLKSETNKKHIAQVAEPVTESEPEPEPLAAEPEPEKPRKKFDRSKLGNVLMGIGAIGQDFAYQATRGKTGKKLEDSMFGQQYAADQELQRDFEKIGLNQQNAKELQEIAFNNNLTMQQKQNAFIKKMQEAGFTHDYAISAYKQGLDVLASWLSRPGTQSHTGGPIASRGYTNYASGGYTGPGGKYEQAGIVHKGEYVIPKEDVDQSTGLPKPGAIGGGTGRPPYIYVGYTGPNNDIRMEYVIPEEDMNQATGLPKPGAVIKAIGRKLEANNERWARWFKRHPRHHPDWTTEQNLEWLRKYKKRHALPPFNWTPELRAMLARVQKRMAETAAAKKAEEAAAAQAAVHTWAQERKV